jgi:large subunit ribosomal protein L3
MPRHGSLGYSPRKRSKRIYVTVRSFPKSDKSGVLGFAGYKAGMTHIIATDTHEKSPSYGQKISVPATVLECPSLFVFGVRAYKKTPYGLRAVSEVFADKLSKDLSRKFTLPKNYVKEDKITKIEKSLPEIVEFRALAHTQPRKIKLKKKPEVFELLINGENNEDIWKYALGILGKEIKVNEVFEENQSVDVIAVTRGKGTQGPVKRWGVAIQTRKAHGHRRFPGSIGAWHPARVLWTAPQAGQMGYQRRTELNKRILKIGDNGKEVTPRGGFVKYGEVSGDYLLVEGSVPGPKKRLVFIRPNIRKSKDLPALSISQISLNAQQ